MVDVFLMSNDGYNTQCKATTNPKIPYTNVPAVLAAVLKVLSSLVNETSLSVSM